MKNFCRISWGSEWWQWAVAQREIVGLLTLVLRKHKIPKSEGQKLTQPSSKFPCASFCKCHCLHLKQGSTCRFFHKYFTLLKLTSRKCSSPARGLTRWWVTSTNWGHDTTGNSPRDARHSANVLTTAPKKPVTRGTPCIVEVGRVNETILVSKLGKKISLFMCSFNKFLIVISF